MICVIGEVWILSALFSCLRQKVSLGLGHGEGGAFVLKGSALVLGQTGLDNTFPLGGVVGFVRHGGSTPFKLQRTIFI